MRHESAQATAAKEEWQEPFMMVASGKGISMKGRTAKLAGVRTLTLAFTLLFCVLYAPKLQQC